MPLSTNSNDFKSSGDVNPPISIGPASISMASTSPSNHPFESLHSQGAESMLFSGSDNSHQYLELPKLDGLNNLHSNLDAVADDEGGPNYSKITF